MPPVEPPTLPPAPAICPSLPESTAKFQSATDQRDAELEDVLPLKSVTALVPDLVVNIVLPLSAPALAKTVEGVLPLTPATAPEPDTLVLSATSQSAMPLLDADLEDALPTKHAPVIKDGPASTAPPLSATHHAPTESASDQMPATALEPTTPEPSAKPPSVNLFANMDLCALPLTPVTALLLDLDGVDLSAKLLIAVLTHAKTVEFVLPLANVTVLILDTKDLHAKLMKMSAKDLTLLATKDSNV